MEDEGYIISGMTTSLSGDNLVIADGLFYYRGRIVRFQESSYDTTIVPGAGTAVMIVITTESTNLQMHNGSTLADAITELVASVEIADDTVTEDSFLYAKIKPWLYGAGAKSRAEWDTYSYTGSSGNGSPTLTMYIKYDPFSNSVYCRGDVAFAAAQNLPTTAGSRVTVGTLPAKYRPSYTSSNWNFNLGQISVANYKDSTNIQYVDMAFGTISSGGSIDISVQRPETGVSFTWYSFSFVMPLD